MDSFELDTIAEQVSYLYVAHDELLVHVLEQVCDLGRDIYRHSCYPFLVA